MNLVAPQFGPKFGLIYTIGQTENYRRYKDAAEAEGRVFQKAGRYTQDDGTEYPGGWVWQTPEDAERWMAEEGAKLDPPYTAERFTVWGVDADWKRDTAPPDKPGQSYRHLVNDSPLIDLQA